MRSTPRTPTRSTPRTPRGPQRSDSAPPLPVSPLPTNGPTTTPSVLGGGHGPVERLLDDLVDAATVEQQQRSNLVEAARANMANTNDLPKCLICNTEIQSDAEDHRTVLPCGHFYHTTCMTGRMAFLGITEANKEKACVRECARPKCGICLSCLNENPDEDLKTLPRCMHTFHRECIERHQEIHDFPDTMACIFKCHAAPATSLATLLDPIEPPTPVRSARERRRQQTQRLSSTAATETMPAAGAPPLAIAVDGDDASDNTPLLALARGSSRGRGKAAGKGAGKAAGKGGWENGG